MGDTVSNDLDSKALSVADCLIPGLAVTHHARKPDSFGDPAAIFLVICRQQPSTAKGFVFLSLEDETGIANIILEPDVFTKLRTTVLTNSYLLIEGILRNQRGVRSVRAEDAQPCHMPTTTAVASHDVR